MTSNRLPILQAEARAAHDDAMRHSMAAAERALAAGAALAEAKSLCAHGQWLPWLAEAGIPERSAQRYMKLHNAGLKSATVADLGLSEAEVIAGLMAKLWPKKDPGGLLLEGWDGQRHFAAVVAREGDFAFYGVMHGLGQPGHHARGASRGGQILVLKRPVSRQGLALVHKSEVGGIPFERADEIDGDAARAELDAWRGFSVDMSALDVAGVRLETLRLRLDAATTAGECQDVMREAKAVVAGLPS